MMLMMGIGSKKLKRRWLIIYVLFYFTTLEQKPIREKSLSIISICRRRRHLTARTCTACRPFICLSTLSCAKCGWRLGGAGFGGCGCGGCLWERFDVSREGRVGGWVIVWLSSLRTSRRRLLSWWTFLIPIAWDWPDSQPKTHWPYLTQSVSPHPRLSSPLPHDTLLQSAPWTPSH